MAKTPKQKPRRNPRFLDPAALDAAVGAVAHAAAAAGVRVALGGGLAMHAYGSDRLTGDVDVVASGAIPGYRGRALSFGGVSGTAPNGVPTDVIVRDDDYADLYAEALERPRRVPGVAAPVVAPEYLAAMKMVAGRGKDTTDLEYLITSGELDHAKARKVIRKHLGPYAATEFDALVEEAAFMQSRKK